MEWTTNNFFSLTPVPFSHFDSLHFQHYNPSPEFEGPFLKSLRLNLWNATTGEFMLLRNQDVKFAVKHSNGASAQELVTTSTDCSTYEELRHLLTLTQLFQEQDAALGQITNMMKQAWTKIVGDHDIPALTVQDTVVVIVIGKQDLCCAGEAGKLFGPRTEEMLQAVANQKHRASAVWVVIDGMAKDDDSVLVAELERKVTDLFLKVSPAWGFELQPGAIGAGRSGSRRVNVVRNSRTKGNKLGAWNWGNMQSIHHFSSDSADPLVAFVDPMTATCWRQPDFLRRCIMQALRDEISCRERVDVVMSSTGHLALARQSTLLRAGLFDEAFSGHFDGSSSIAEADLLIRLLDLGVCARRVDIPSSLEILSHVDCDDVAYFWYKHGIRKGNFPAKIQNIVDKHLQGSAPTTDESPDMKAENVPFEMMNGEQMFLRRETLRVATSDISDGSTGTRPTMLVGVITSNLDRVRGLLSDLGCMLADAKHCVMVFANVAEEGSDASNSFVARLKRLLESYRFRSRVLTGTDVFTASAGQSYDVTTADAAPDFPLPIAAARTVLQTWMLATTQEIENRFEFAAVIDDDMRLPSFWGDSLGEK
eukprot:329977-Rhodomonas_salina.1